MPCLDGKKMWNNFLTEREREREIAQVSGVVDTQSSLECREPCIPVC